MLWPGKTSNAQFIEQIRQQRERRRRWRWLCLGGALVVLGLSMAVAGQLLTGQGFFYSQTSAERMAFLLGGLFGLLVATIFGGCGPLIGAFIQSLVEDRKTRLLLEYHDALHGQAAGREQ